MKSLAAAIALFYFASTMAAAPYGIKGQQQTSTLYSNVHQFPNNQVTNMGGIDAVVETGNSNILSNPSFEHLTANTGWVDNGTATGIGTAVAVISGKKAYGFLPTAQTINLTQSSTLYQAQFADGVQGLAMVRIKSDVALKVCSIQAGTVSTTNCVNTNTDSKWGLYKVPFILGATSNGISISSTGVSVTGSTVIVDDAFVGAQDVTQNITACRTADCTTEFSAFVATAGTVSNENIDSINGNCVLTNGTTTTCTFNAGLYTVAPNCAVSGNGGGEKFLVSVSSTTVAIGYANSAGSGGAKTDVTIICQKQGVDFSTAQSLARGNVYSSSCGANCVDTFSANVTAAGVVTSQVSDFISGSCSVTASPNKINCTFKSGLFTVSPSCVAQNNGASTGSDIIATSTTTSGFSVNYVASTVREFNVICQKQGADFIANRTIIGSFAEVVTSQGTTSPDVQGVIFGSGTNCNTACSTGTCTICNQTGNKITSVTWSATGVYDVNGLDGTKYICTGAGRGTSYVPIFTSRQSGTSSLVKINAGSVTGLFNAADGTIVCMGAK